MLNICSNICFDFEGKLSQDRLFLVDAGVEKRLRAKLSPISKCVIDEVYSQHHAILWTESANKRIKMR